MRRIVDALGGELGVSARFSDGTVKIEPFDEAGGGNAVSLWILGGFGNDRIGARRLPAAGPALPDWIGCSQGFDERFYIRDDFTFPRFLARGCRTRLFS